MCKRPLGRLETFDRYINKQGGTSYRAIFVDWVEVERNPKFYKAKYRKVDQIGCGNCIECRLAKSRDKANQMILEKKEYPEDQVWFITLTYSDEYLPFHHTVDTSTGEIIEGVSLCKKDAQDFIKRLRRYYEYNYGVKGIRYVICGEYGTETHRPHYHLIAYGLPLDVTKLKKHSVNDMGQTLWKHEEIAKIWGKGHIIIGRVSWDTCAYVSRYLMKKQYGQNTAYYQACGCIPEFINQSLKPPIGRNYLEKNKEQIYHTDSIPVVGKSGVNEVKPPKSYDNYMMQHNPDMMEKIKRKRKINAECKERAVDRITDLSRQERRDARDALLREKTKTLRREL